MNGSPDKAEAVADMVSPEARKAGATIDGAKEAADAAEGASAAEADHVNDAGGANEFKAVEAAPCATGEAGPDQASRINESARADGTVGASDASDSVWLTDSGKADAAETGEARSGMETTATSAVSAAVAGLTVPLGSADELARFEGAAICVRAGLCRASGNPFPAPTAANRIASNCVVPLSAAGTAI